MRILLLVGLSMAALSMGCANMVAAPPAKIYSPSERMLLQGPGRDLGATGEALYCARTDRASYAADLKRSALANIARACGGESNYAVLGEGRADAVETYGAWGTVATRCGVGDGRAIYFRCQSAAAQPASQPKSK